jgi:hypothetical protein
MKHLKDDSPEVSPAPVDRPDSSRRRFVIGTLAAAPLLVTLTARPARAQGTGGSLGNYGSVAP